MDKHGGSFRLPPAHWISEIPRIARERGEARHDPLPLFIATKEN